MQIYQKIFLWVQHLTYVLARFYPKKSAAQYKLAACKDFSLQAANLYRIAVNLELRSSVHYFPPHKMGTT